ncbi:MAG: hypothetical protein Kow00120_00190 [Anaerolineae bacterium]
MSEPQHHDLEATLASVSDALEALASGDLERRAVFLAETPGAARLNAALARLADTLQQRAAEAETHRRQDADYTAIFDAAPVMIWYKDTENRILRLNKAAAAAMGRTVAEVEGRSVYDLHDRADAEQYHQDDLEVINSGQPKLGIVEALRSPEGETRWIQTDKVPTFDAEGNVTGVVVVSQDVTAQKETEQALVASHTELETLVRERTTALEAERSLLRAVIDNLPDNVFVKDTGSRIILDNVAHRRLLGAATEAEVVGRSDFDFFEAELAEQYFADEQQILQTGEARLNYEEPSVDPEGNRRWLSTTKVPFRDSQGNVVGIIGINHDITNRKQMEEQLAEERNLLRTLVDALPDIVYVKDTESRFLLINDIHARLLGEARIEDTLGKTDYDYYPREMADGFRADDLRVIQSGEPVTHEERALGADGEEVWILTTKAPFRDASGNVIGLVGIGRDLTERKRAEEALANERNLLRTLIDTLPDVIYAKDAESRFVMGNMALTTQLGAPSLDAVIGKTDFDFHPRELAEQYFADEQAIMQSGEPLIDREEVVVDAATGEARWFQTTKAPVKDAAGRVVGLVGIGRDVTARKQAEAEREQLLSEVRRNERLLRSVLDATPDWIFIKDQEFRYTLVNQGYADALHMKPDDVIGKDDLELGFPEELVFGNPEKNIRGFRTDDTAVLERGETLVNPNDPATIDGEVHVFHTFKTPLRDAQERVIGVLGLSRDITERQQLLNTLERRSLQLQAGAEVSEVANALLDLESLQQRVVDLIRERFDLYYVGLFLVDQNRQPDGEPGQWAVLRAGTGEAGRAMLARQHKLEVGGESMIGWCVANAKARVALDIGDEAVRFENPLLPETRSEMALPLIARARVIGAVTIQSAAPAAFSDEDIAALQTMANQIAVAIENARLFEAARQRAASEELLNRVAGQLQEHTDLEAMLHVTMRELGQALGARRARARLRVSQDNGRDA